MNRPLFCIVAFAAAAPCAHAQLLDVQEAARAVSGQTYGFDYEYDDGLADSSQAAAPTGAWNEAIALAQVDHWGFDVATADAEQQSSITSSVLSFDLDVAASAAGNHFAADSRARTQFETRFVLEERVWYEAAFSAGASVGYQSAHAVLSLHQGPTLLSASADQGGTDAAAAGGWLPADEYVLRGEAECFAYGTHGQSDARHAAAAASFEVFHELDATRDGVVDPSDRRRFRRAWFAGHPSADFEGDGDVDAQDWVAYTAAFLAYWI